MTAVLQTHELIKRFGNWLAVDHLNLRVDEGELFGFLGPNGAGKTSSFVGGVGCFGVCGSGIT